MTDDKRKAYIEDHGGGPVPGEQPLENMIFTDRDGTEWLLCSDGLWTRTDQIERLIGSKGECPTCGCPLHPGWPHRKCRWCRRVWGPKN